MPEEKVMAKAKAATKANPKERAKPKGLDVAKVKDDRMDAEKAQLPIRGKCERWTSSPTRGVQRS